jgi:hypothetical protein
VRDEPVQDMAGIGLVIAGVAVYQAPRETNWAQLRAAGKMTVVQVSKQYTVAAARAIGSPVAAA